ncbi:MAG: hypothetical protein HPY85_16970 [Anaerolineae bacterium]|jgi:hypothetical protein|nr:hypothetical protein [Anaerolineae bacterium]
MATKVKGKISKTSKTNAAAQNKKTAADHKRRSTQIIFLAVSVVIILAMVLSMISF